MANAPTTQIRRIAKGELLFSEGDNSRAMYLVKNGMIRIFKKKGTAQIEIDTIHTGQVVGELAFLDGNTRSASAEAMVDCELLEISGPTFTAVLSAMPEWLKILLKAIVGRLRTASTRIRQLESASTAISYSDTGTQSKDFVFLSNYDVMKISMAILVVVSRHGKKIAEGTEIKTGLLQRYGNNILGIPVAKITTFLDVLSQAGALLLTDESADSSGYFLRDPAFLEGFLNFMNDENLLKPTMRHEISPKGFLVMSAVAKFIPNLTIDPKSQIALVNIAEIKKFEKGTKFKEPIRTEDFSELVELGYASPISIKSSDEIFTTIKPDTFLQAYRFQKIVIILNSVNERKRRGYAA